MSNVGQVKNPAALNTAITQDRKSQATGKQAPSAQPGSVQESAQVQISSAGSALSDADDSTFDSAKVNALAQAIKDGKFTVNAGAIADKLISNAHELLSRSNSTH